MKSCLLTGILFCMTVSLSFAQAQVVGNYAVHLGVMSWENIQADTRGEETSMSARQRQMAKQMASMHGGAEKGYYHLLVVIDDRDSGQAVEDAEVRVVVSGADGQQKSATLERMEMADFFGYGGYLRFNFMEPYILQVFFRRSTETANHMVEFSRSH